MTPRGRLAAVTHPEPHADLLAGPPPTLLPEDAEAEQMLRGGADAASVAAAHPAFATAWATLSDEAYERGALVESYAYARTGYHRSLDQLRRAGWRGSGPVPWEHAANRGFLRSLHALGRAAAAIGENDEAERCTTFLQDSSPEAASALRGS